MPIALTIRSEANPADIPISFEPRQVILGGYSARSAATRERHIDELREIGIEPPERVPAFWHVSPFLVTTGALIEVQGDHTSGEIEYALVASGGRVYVALASDQTDRAFERYSIPRSKQLCPKVLSAEVVPLDEVRGRWDEIVISSEVSSDGARWLPYQEAPLADLIDPDELLRASGIGTLPEGGVLLSGTVPLVDGVTRYAAHFRGVMRFPDRSAELALAYRVDVMPEIETVPAGVQP